MNRLSYRIVFNTKRGQLLAVSECAKAQGKSCAESAAQSPRNADTPKIGKGWLRNTLAGAATLALHSLAGSQIIADPTAPATQRPTVLTDTAGRPLVNIQTPSGAGVSRNTYNRFDVQSNGIVLNNARGSNPWLAQGEARVILNEVNSSNPSYLGGAITVNGQRAQVVIANPSGIKVDGASFVNASRATLTTGTATLANGSLTGINVTQGLIEIGSKGLDARGSDYAEILSRQAVVGGRIDANVFNVTTGAQSIDYATGQLTSKAGVGAAPVWGIDTVALGGMYAGSITLLSTELGVGVRNAGTLEGNATTGQLIVTADGRLENTGRMDAGVTSVATVTGNIDNSGALTGRQALVASAGADFNQSGTGMVQATTTASQVYVNANRYVNLAAGARIASNGAPTLADGSVARGQVFVSASRDVNLAAGSSIDANGAVQVNADGLITSSTATVSSTAGNTTLLAAKGISLTGSTVTGNRAHLETGTPFQATTSHISISGGQVNGVQQTSVIASGNLLISSAGATGVQSTGGHIFLQAGQDLTMAARSTATAAGHFTAIAGQTLSLQGGNAPGAIVTINALGDATLSGGRLSLQASQINATGALSIAATTGDVVLDSLKRGWSEANFVTLTAGGNLDVSAYQGNILAWGLTAKGHHVNVVSNGITKLSGLERDVLALSGSVEAKGDLVVGSIRDTGSVVNYQTRLTAAGAIQMIAPGSISFWAPTVRGADIRIQGGSISMLGQDWWGSMPPDYHTRRKSSGGGFATTGHVNFTATSGDLILDDSSFIASLYFPLISAAGNVALHANKNVELREVSAVSGGSMAITSATGFLRVNGNLTASDVLSLSSDLGQYYWGTYKAGAISIFSQRGSVGVDGFRDSLYAGSVKNAALQQLSGQISIDAAGDLYVSSGMKMNAVNDIHLTARGGILKLAGSPSSTPIYARPTRLTAGRDLTLTGAAVELQASKLSSGRDTSITSHTGAVLIDGLKNPFSSYVPTERIAELDQLTPQSVEREQLRQLLAAGPRGYEHTGASISGRNINITSAGGLAVYGADISGTGAVSLSSAGVFPVDSSAPVAEQQKPIGTLLAGLSDFYELGSLGGSNYSYAVMSRPTVVSGKLGVSVQALGDNPATRLVLNDVGLNSTEGTVRLQSLGDMRLESGQEEFYSQSISTYTKRSWLGFVKKRVTEIRTTQAIEASPVAITGQNILLKSGGSIDGYATDFMAPQGQIQITAANALSLYAIPQVYFTSFDVNSRSSLLGITLNKEKSVTTRQVSSQLPANLVAQSASTNSGWNTLLQGTKFHTSLGPATISVGVGANARADAQIILEGIKRTVTESKTRESNYVVWQRQVGSGSTVETLTLPQFTGPVKPVFNGPVLAQIPEGNFKTQVQNLSQQPGMGYLNDLSKRTDVKWQPVKLAFDQWSYDKEGLTPAGAALLGVAVAWATGGMGVDLLGSTTSTTVGGVTTTTTTLGGSTLAVNGVTTTLGNVINAGFTSLSAQAAIVFVNNKGDIGKTLKDLARSETVKATLGSMLTAGALSKINAIPEIKALNGVDAGFTDKLTFNLINAGGRALTNTAINGGSLQDALRGALLGGVVDTAHGEVASQIKLLESEYLVHKLAHALAGCVAGAAAQGTCKDGAIGAAVGEIVVQLMPPSDRSVGYTEAERIKALNYSKLVAGAVAAYAGGDAQTAITTAETAVKNNGLMELIKPRPVQKQNFLTVSNKESTEKIASIDTERQRITLIQPAESMLYAAGTGGPQVEGYTVIFAHASDGSIQGVKPSDTKEWNAFVEMIKTSGAWKPGQPILLDACNSGKIDAGVASALAKSLGTHVTGATTQTWNIPAYSTSGFTGAYDKLTDNLPNLSRPGLWRTFGPTGVLTGVTPQMPQPSTLR